MSNPFNIFKLRKDERWLAAIALIVFVVFNALACSRPLGSMDKGSLWRFLLVVYALVYHVGI